MQLTERHIIIGDQAIENICVKAKNLYNQALYYLRQSTFGKIQHFSEYELTGLFAKFKQDDYKALPAATAQQIIKLLFQNYKSWYKARKEWTLNPAKFLARPKLPKYKKTSSIVIFTSQQCNIKNGFIYFPKLTALESLKTKVDNICQVRIIPQATCYVIEVIYEKEVTNLNLSKENVLSIDLGLNNLATCVTNVGQPFLVSGKIMKSFNQWYNKTKAQLQSFLENKKYTSNKLNAITHYRNCWIEDKLHKVSRYIVNYCIENNIGHIIIGQNKQWKQDINIGKRNNQAFVNISHSKLIDKISYKATLVGISVDTNEESYTSKCDALALEVIGKQEVYLGKRVKRGLFQSSIGIVVNADVNGAINIARKVIGDCFVKSIINSGLAFNPVKLNIV